MRELIRRIYNLLPFKKQIFQIVRSIYTPSKKVYRHLHFKDVFKVKFDKGSDFKMIHFGYSLENEIFWSGLENGWEKESINIWKRLSKRSNIIFDIGANTGIFSLVSKAISKESEVYSFEPVTRVFDKLLMNVKENNFKVACHKLALSDYTGKAHIYDPGGEHVYSVSVNKNLEFGKRGTERIEIPVKRLDLFISENKIGRIDLMKIDVEQHEAEVLEGYGVLLNKHRPSLLIEILTDEVGNAVEQIVKNCEYLFFNIDEEMGCRRVNKLTKSDSFNYLLCQEDVAKYLELI